MRHSFKRNPWGIWVAQSVKRPTLDFGSGHDLSWLGELELHVGLCADGTEPAWDSVRLPLSLCSSPQLMLILSLKINK